MTATPEAANPAPKFGDIKFYSFLGGKAGRLAFPNGYGVSVICHQYSYGGKEGLFELAVLRDGEVVYDTPVTDDVVGHLSPRDVTRLIRKVAALPAKVPS